MKGRVWCRRSSGCVLSLALLASGGCGGGGGHCGEESPAATSTSPSHNPQPQPQPQPPSLPKTGGLTDWKGDWKSWSVFVDDDAMDPVYAEIVKKTSGTAKGVKGFFEEMYERMPLKGGQYGYLPDDKGLPGST